MTSAAGQNRSLDPQSRTNGRSPEVSSTAFRAQPPDLQPVPLMDMDFAIICSLVQHRMPLIRLLYIGFQTHLTMTPLRFAMTSRHQVVKGNFTLELSNMLGTQKSAH